MLNILKANKTFEVFTMNFGNIFFRRIKTNRQKGCF